MRIRIILPAALLAVSGLLAGTGTTFAGTAGAGAAIGATLRSPRAAAVGYPAYQCFKTKDREEYCSDKKVKNHAAGSAWIKTCPKEVQENMNGKPYLRDPRPGAAESC
ncbi:hypothetical protein [Streptomyces noursei]|uniref:hypothetical protein n=1 Tax=Streptomyces noursei TaxID=1971 RepID=UPI0019C785E4|nr:hypothetical protein [Streptomyces noursei]MCZ1014391.1 hypothetical protein [Streptomyces noursei]GGW94651.1 hypothetical protein GCM10010341_14760 [Streptomyces noursei]